MRIRRPALIIVGGLRHSTSPFHSLPSQFQPNSDLISLCRHGRLREALLQMALQVPPLDAASYAALLGCCTVPRALSEGRRIHAHMIKTRFFPRLYLATRLLLMYIKCDALDDARQVLDRMPERSIVSWTAVIAGCSRSGRHDEALQLFIRMMTAGALPNEFTLASILTACSGPSGIRNGRQMHSLAIKTSFESHMFVGSSLLDMYAKAGEILEAQRVFDILPERDVVSCTAIISGYAQLGLDDEALQLFRKLHKEGLDCNYVTFASLLTALSGLAALDYGRQVHCLVIRCEIPSNVVLQNSLIDMYSKCGNLQYARKVFDNMPERSVISWNAMLVGYGKHGLGREVIQLFKVLHQEVKPDGVTYLAVMTGCSHGGLVDEGLDVFDKMVDERCVKPEVEHYGCLVDILGRAGRIQKALDIIKSMPFKPTTAMWGSLLGACRAHFNVSFGEIIAQRLLEIEPENSGNYVILSNIYAATERWKDVSRVRELMKDNMVIKEPGRSRIVIDKILHTFYSSDHAHPLKDQINTKIMELYVKIKEAGYNPDLSCVLHDVDDEQKERILLGHSEKLAIAFGLMATAPSSLIRITKNLRICVDCHNFAKYISKVCARDISIRDSNRFHLMVRGACTCGDFW